MLRFLIEKEFKQIRRNSFVPKMLIGMPLMVMLVLPWAANQSIKNVNLSIVDNDHSVFSERLVNKITASGYFNMTDFSSSYPQAKRSIESGDADIILEIEPEFENNLVREKVGRVLISANSVNSMKGGLGSSYLTSILTDYTKELTKENRQLNNNSQLSILNYYSGLTPIWTIRYICSLP